MKSGKEKLIKSLEEFTFAWQLKGLNSAIIANNGPFAEGYECLNAFLCGKVSFQGLFKDGNVALAVFEIHLLDGQLKGIKFSLSELEKIDFEQIAHDLFLFNPDNQAAYWEYQEKLYEAIETYRKVIIRDAINRAIVDSASFVCDSKDEPVSAHDLLVSIKKIFIEKPENPISNKELFKWYSVGLNAKNRLRNLEKYLGCLAWSVMPECPNVIAEWLSSER